MKSNLYWMVIAAILLFQPGAAEMSEEWQAGFQAGREMGSVMGFLEGQASEGNDTARYLFNSYVDIVNAKIASWFGHTSNSTITIGSSETLANAALA